MTDTELRAPATPTAAQSAALLAADAVIRVLERHLVDCPGWYTEGEHACDGSDEVCARTCPVPVQVECDHAGLDLSLTREALADGLAIAHLKERRNSFWLDWHPSAWLVRVRPDEGKGIDRSLPQAVAAALDER